MTFGWLKRYVPRGLYGRAALILILPVVALQLVVSVVFIQRHFEGVTEQMTGAISRELDLIQGAVAVGLDPGEIAARLDVQQQSLPLSAVPPDHIRPWYDLSGRAVIATLARLRPDLLAVSLADDKVVRVYSAATEPAAGAVEYAFGRERVSASNPHQLFVNMVVFGALMTAIAYVYLRNQLRPVTTLAKVAAAFGRGQHLPYKPAGAAEVRAAGQAFVDMRSRIERQIEQRTLMLSGVSHDLRTPLTRLRLGLSLLDEAERAPLERDLAEMQKMIEGFLDFARGTAEDAPEAVDPIALIHSIVDDAQRAGIAVELVETAELGPVSLRPLAVRRAVENLIGNAVRYGHRAEVSLTATSRGLCIRVEDDGPGIPAEQRAEALRPFQRLDAARNQDRGGGVGLGLSIAADVARAHGGALRLGDSSRLGGLQADLVIAR
ncbi:ATP-binding protein [Pseudooceanicola sp.]|uniref:ATP-binding protein n=1 Tax=Pseudooceanicola sp. TaxID=1914328 RepID=UPI00261AF533|nr:ATP-binding protein [Pseudooceanicola sp.]MDF1855565.1 ATP-binding protein [Pseudooceanicola sp.]